MSVQEIEAAITSLPPHDLTKLGEWFDGYRTHVVDLDAAYAAMAEDEARETDALAWSEALLSDVATDDDETR